MNDRIIREDLEIHLWETLLGPDWHPTRRQRLRAKWRNLRWRLGHKIVGHDCDEDF